MKEMSLPSFLLPIEGFAPALLLPQGGLFATSPAIALVPHLMAELAKDEDFCEPRPGPGDGAFAQRIPNGQGHGWNKAASEGSTRACDGPSGLSACMSTRLLSFLRSVLDDNT